MLEQLLEEARADENVRGVIVHGSRGRGLHVHEGSDWDVVVVVRELTGRYDSRDRGGELEAFEVTSLARLPQWMLPAVTWTTPALDKTGAVAAELAEVTKVDPASAAEPLDAYVNSYYRSAKNARSGLGLAALLDAQESVPHYLHFLFAVHGRLRPYNKWLEWELREHPLPVAVDLPRLERIARTGDIEEQQALFRDMETLARERGHGTTIDGWEPDVAWLRG
ncbi:MAG TPA: nucleotidyltransferase domain-containing protein [Gaiellaceae bacterium]|nr:nucleotidyltransferase domain-containing protein [Gaiellaceae bacterium]